MFYGDMLRRVKDWIDVKKTEFLGRIRNKLLGTNVIAARLDVVQRELTSFAHSLEAVRQGMPVRAIEQMLEDMPKAADLHLLATHESVEMLREQVMRDTAAMFARHPAAWTSPYSARSGEQVSKRDVTAIPRVAFLVHALELSNHFGCVWDLMPRGTFDILLYGEADQLRDTSAFARWNCRVESAAEILAAGTKYRYLVSNHPMSLGEDPFIKQLAEINVRFMYAAGKSGWNLSEWNDLYDVIMCFGPYHAVNFSYCSRATIIQMGYPRFDRFFTEKIDREALCRRYDCNPDRPTVVWLPTWKTLSSVGWFDEEISALMDSYNVVVKLHPLMTGSEPDRVAALAKHRLTLLIDDSQDNLPLYQLADYMLFDYGGPPLAGIYTDKRFVLLNVPGATTDPLVGMDSPDMAIRNHLISVNHAERGIRGVLEDESVWDRQAESRRMLRKQYFAPYFGISAKIAAECLLNLDALTSDRMGV